MTGQELVAFAKSKLGVPYVYGMKGKVMTEAIYNDSVKVFSQKQIWPFGSRQSTGYDIRQQIILCF